jgi:hypothetical protein
MTRLFRQHAVMASPGPSFCLAAGRGAERQTAQPIIALTPKTKPPQPPPAWLTRFTRQLRFLDNREQGLSPPLAADNFGRLSTSSKKLWDIEK